MPISKLSGDAPAANRPAGASPVSWPPPGPQLDRALAIQGWVLGLTTAHHIHQGRLGQIVA